MSRSVTHAHIDPVDAAESGTVKDYYRRCAIDGRAVLLYRAAPDEAGQAQPGLWICELGRAFVVCDFHGGDTTGEDDSYVRAESPSTTIAEVRLHYRASRRHTLAEKVTRRRSLPLDSPTVQV